MTPPDLPVSESRIDCHHSGGMLSRCHHFETAEAGALISDAIASRAPQAPLVRPRQRSITSRNEASSAMSESLGQFVLKNKANVSHDCEHRSGEIIAMPDRVSETEQQRLFIARTKLARESRFPTQKPILTLLELDQGTYKQYERRSPLPHRYIPKFIAACGVTYEWLLAGEGVGPAAVEQRPPVARRGRKPKPKKAG